MTKRQLAEAIATIGAGKDKNEFNRIVKHQMARPLSQVKESFARQSAINQTSQYEINLHCQPAKLNR